MSRCLELDHDYALLPRLLICLIKQALGLALPLPGCGPQADVDGVSHDENRHCF